MDMKEVLIDADSSIIHQIGDEKTKNIRHLLCLEETNIPFADIKGLVVERGQDRLPIRIFESFIDSKNFLTNIVWKEKKSSSSSGLQQDTHTALFLP